MEFGEPGQIGSFRVKFDALGAGVVFLQLMDNFVDTAARQRAERGDFHPDDYQLLVYAGGDYSFRVRQSRDKPLFKGQRLDLDRWEHEVDEDSDEVRFWIDSDNGLRLTKTFRHRPELRGLVLELKLENRGSESLSGAFLCDLGGAALVNKSELMLFTAPPMAIGVAEGGEPEYLQPEPGQRKELLSLQGLDLSMTGTTNRFFGGFFWPDNEASRQAVTRVDVTAVPRQDDPLAGKAGSMPHLRLNTRVGIPRPGADEVVSFNVFLGPKSFRVFDEQPEFARFLPIMDVDLEPPCCGLSVPGGRFMAASLLKLLGWFESIIGSWASPS